MNPDTRTSVLRLLQLIGEGDPDRIASLYAEYVDWKLDWPAGEHGRTGRGSLFI